MQRDFSTSKLVALPFGDAVTYIDDFLRALPDGGVISIPHSSMIVEDVQLLLERCDRAKKAMVERADPAAPAAMASILQLLSQTLPAAGGKLQARFADGNAFRLKRLSEILGALLAGPNANNINAPEAAPRSAALSLLHSLADHPECKGPIATQCFASLFHFISMPVRDAHHPQGGDDDFSARRQAAHVITTAVRGSAEAKNFVLQRQLLKPVADIVSKTPTGDFFLQLQALEIVYRVTRPQLSTVEALGLPPVLHDSLCGNKLANDANFVASLMSLLDVYNSSRAKALPAAGQGISMPLLSFRTASYLIECDAVSSDPTSDPTSASRIAMSEESRETQVIFSPFLTVLLLPGQNGQNISFNYHQLHTVKISRDHCVHFTFKNVSRDFVMSLINADDPDAASMCDSILGQPQGTMMIKMHLRFDSTVGMEVRGSHLQGWVQAALARKKERAKNSAPAAVVPVQQNQNPNQNQNQFNNAAAAHLNQDSAASNNTNKNQQQDHHSRAASSATNMNTNNKTVNDQQQQQQQQATTAFGTRRDPNSQRVQADSAAASQCPSEQNSQMQMPQHHAGEVPPQQARPPQQVTPSSALEFHLQQQDHEYQQQQSRDSSSGGVEGLMGTLRSLIGERIVTKRNASQSLLQDTVMAIQRRVEESREVGRRERDELELWIRSEIAAVSKLEQSVSENAQCVIGDLNAELGELSETGNHLQEELRQARARVEESISDARDIKDRHLTEMKQEVERALAALETTLTNLSPETALPLRFLQNLAGRKY